MVSPTSPRNGQRPRLPTPTPRTASRRERQACGGPGLRSTHRIASNRLTAGQSEGARPAGSCSNPAAAPRVDPAPQPWWWRQDESKGRRRLLGMHSAALCVPVCPLPGRTWLLTSDARLEQRTHFGPKGQSVQSESGRGINSELCSRFGPRHRARRWLPAMR